MLYIHVCLKYINRFVLLDYCLKRGTHPAEEDGTAEDVDGKAVKHGTKTFVQNMHPFEGASLETLQSLH